MGAGMSLSRGLVDMGTRLWFWLSSVRPGRNEDVRARTVRAVKRLYVKWSAGTPRQSPTRKPTVPMSQ